MGDSRITVPTKTVETDTTETAEPEATETREKVPATLAAAGIMLGIGLILAGNYYLDWGIRGLCEHDKTG